MFDKLTDFFYSLYELYYNLPLFAKATMVLTIVASVVLVVWFLLKRKKKRVRKEEVSSLYTPIPAQQSNTVVVSEVMLQIPVAEVENESKLIAEAALRSPQLKANILVIEDDPVMLLAISSILNRSGFNLVTAKDGKEAFEQLEKGNYDIVVTDLMMPYANGLEVVSRIRGDISKRHVGVIVCSSVGNEDTITEAYRLGADDYIKKPIKTDELLLRIKILLDRRKDNPKLVTKKTMRAHVW